MTVMKGHAYIPCFTAEMKKATVHAAPDTDHYGDLHFDIYGPIATFLSGSAFAVHYMESLSTIPTSC